MSFVNLEFDEKIRQVHGITPDSGVFSTSFEREYTLMGIALEKTDDERFSNSPRAVREWLNRVRKMSVEQRFKK